MIRPANGTFSATQALMLGGGVRYDVRQLSGDALTTLPPMPPPAEIGKVIHDAAVSIAQGDRAVQRRSEQMLLTFARIESGFDPSATTGSYKGLYQLSDEEFRRYGGGNIYSAKDNAMAAVKKLKAESDEFQQQKGRRPDATDIYMIHQQGSAGYGRHLGHPTDPAWINMNIASGRSRDDEWGKRAIWGNMSAAMKAKFPGGVTTVKSRDFVALWRQEVDGLYTYYAKYVRDLGPTLPAVSRIRA